MRVMKKKNSVKRAVSVMTVASLLGATAINLNGAPVVNAATTSVASNLGPVTGKDVIYQIVTDRFYNGDTSNDIPAGFNSAYFDGTGRNVNLYQGGDFAGIVQKIPYLKQMGITAVWITAPYGNRETATVSGNNAWVAYHGYHARNYFTTNEHFGTMNDFKNMRDQLHANGIKLVIDFVTNHTSDVDVDGNLYEPDKLADGSYAIGADGRPYDANGDGVVENLVASPRGINSDWFHLYGNREDSQTDTWSYRNKDLAHLADFNHENSATTAYLEKVAAYWTALGIDGMRHDATLHMNPAYVKGLVDANQDVNTITQFGEFFIGRPSDKYAEYASFPDRTGVSDLDFEFYNAALTTFGSFSSTMEDFGNMLMYTSADYSYENQTVTFLDNHDVSRFGYNQQNKKIVNEALVALLTSRGIPNIYYGTEQYVNPGTGSNDDGRVFMQTATGFSQDTQAYKIIGKLSNLRQNNNALAFGTTNILYSDDNVLVFERQFYDEHVVVAMNRQPDITYTVSNISTALPDGTYADVLGGLGYGDSVSVSGGKISSLTLGGGEVNVWSYDDNNDATATPRIGNVVNFMGRAGQKVYISGQGLGGNPQVYFGTAQAQVVSATDSEIVAIVPSGAVAGKNALTVKNNGTVSNAFTYNVLSGDQNQVIFRVNCNTNWGEKVYVVGNVPELGSWNPDNCSEALLCPSYPEWNIPVSVPAGTRLEFKFIKKDSDGNVVWESGANHVVTTSSDSTGVVVTDIYTFN